MPYSAIRVLGLQTQRAHVERKLRKRDADELEKDCTQVPPTYSYCQLSMEGQGPHMKSIFLVSRSRFGIRRATLLNSLEYQEFCASRAHRNNEASDKYEPITFKKTHRDLAGNDCRISAVANS